MPYAPPTPSAADTTKSGASGKSPPANGNALLNPISQPLVPYDPNFSRLTLSERIHHIVQNLPQLLPFPFSGVIAIQVGNGPIVQACHCPNQVAFTEDQTFNRPLSKLHSCIKIVLSSPFFVAPPQRPFLGRLVSSTRACRQALKTEEEMPDFSAQSEFRKRSNVLSVGKLFTAVALFQLIEEGKFSLDTPLSELLDSDELDLPLRAPYQKPDVEELKKHSSEITLRHLLSHTAGFVEEGWDPEYIGQDCYSNYGYQLLARIIGKHTSSGNSTDHEANFRAHIEERIFRPAGMEIHTSTEQPLDCFEVSEQGIATHVESPDPYPHGNGCWRMTAADLLAFGSALRTHQVLIQESSLQTMMEHPGRLGFWKDCDPETGLVVGYGHPGGGPGMSSFFYTWQTDPPITAVVLSNYSGCDMVKPFLDPIMLNNADRL